VQVKVKAHELRQKNRDELLRQLEELKTELQQLRVAKVTGGAASKLSKMFSPPPPHCPSRPRSFFQSIAFLSRLPCLGQFVVGSPGSQQGWGVRVRCRIASIARSRGDKFGLGRVACVNGHTHHTDTISV